MVDPRTPWPLDKQTLIDSVKKTSRAIVVDERFSPVLEDLTVSSAKMVFEAAKALSRKLTEAIERRKIAWFERRIALAGCRRSALTGDEP